MGGIRFNQAAVAGLVTGSFIGALCLNKFMDVKENQAKQEVVSNPDITGSQLNDLNKRVESGKTTYIAFNDSVNNVKQTAIDKLKQAEEAQVNQIKDEVSHFSDVTAQKFNSFEQRAQKDLHKWTAINDSLKAQKLFKLAKTIK